MLSFGVTWKAIIGILVSVVPGKDPCNCKSALIITLQRSLEEARET